MACPPAQLRQKMDSKKCLPALMLKALPPDHPCPTLSSLLPYFPCKCKSFTFFPPQFLLAHEFESVLLERINPLTALFQLSELLL